MIRVGKNSRRRLLILLLCIVLVAVLLFPIAHAEDDVSDSLLGDDSGLDESVEVLASDSERFVEVGSESLQAELLKRRQPSVLSKNSNNNEDEQYIADESAFITLLESQADKKSPSSNTTVVSTWNQLKSLFSLTVEGGATFHPFKDEIMFLSNKNDEGVLQIYTQPFSRKEKRVLGEPYRVLKTKSRCSNARYLRDGSILFLHDRGGDENFQIGVISPTGRLRWVTQDRKAKNLLNYMTKRYVYISTNAREKQVFDIVRFPIEDLFAKKKRTEILFTPKRGVARVARVLKKDRYLLLERRFSNLHSELLLFDTKTGAIRNLTRQLVKQGKTARFNFFRFLDKKRSRLLVKTDYQSDFYRFAILEFKGGLVKSKQEVPTFIKIAAMDKLGHDVTGLSTNYATGYSYMELNADGYSKLVRLKLDEYGFSSVKPVEIPLEQSIILHGDVRSFGRGIAISKDGSLMAMTLTNAVRPGAIYILDLVDSPTPSGFWQLHPNRNAKLLQRNNFTSATLEAFSSFDKIKVPYFLYVPKNLPVPKGGFPTIIHLHGGPESQTRPVFSAIIQFLTQSGFAVAAPNIRGSRGYGKRYLDSDNQEKRMDAMKDVKALGEHLGKKSIINGKRLVVMGGSYGGYATLMSVVSFPKMWKAGVSVVGMSSLVTFMKHTAEWRRKLRYSEYGNYHTQRELLERLSPINYVERVQAPVFIISGSNDERVPESEAQQMYKRLKQVGKQKGKEQVSRSKLLVFKDEGHGLSKRSNRLIAYHQLLQFLRQNV